MNWKADDLKHERRKREKKRERFMKKAYKKYGSRGGNFHRLKEEFQSS